MNRWKIRKTITKEKQSQPHVAKTASVNKGAEIKGRVYIGENSAVGKSKIISETNHNINVGKDSVIKDYVLIYAKENNSIFNNSDAKSIKDVYIGNKVFISSEVLIHGPSLISDGVYIGNYSAIMNSKIGENCVIEDRVIICNVDIPPETCVPAKSVIDSTEKLNSIIAENKRTDSCESKKMSSLRLSKAC